MSRVVVTRTCIVKLSVTVIRPAIAVTQQGFVDNPEIHSSSGTNLTLESFRKVPW